MPTTDDLIEQLTTARQLAYTLSLAAEAAVEAPAPRDALVGSAMVLVERLDQVLAALRVEV